MVTRRNWKLLNSRTINNTNSPNNLYCNQLILYDYELINNGTIVCAWEQRETIVAGFIASLSEEIMQQWMRLIRSDIRDEKEDYRGGNKKIES